MKIYILCGALSASLLTFAQVGILTENPQGIFNIDGKRDNPTTGVPTYVQQGNDFVVLETGATGIGITTPNAYSMLDVVADNKGILAPRVNLASTTYDLNADSDGNVSNQPQGLLVYNTGTTLPKGYYYWNGTEWLVFDSSTVIPGEIGSLVCASATLSPGGYKTGVPYLGNLKVPYIGGNGGSYQPGNSVTLHGLTFTLRAGKLEYGEGEMVFSVVGTPDTNSDFLLDLTQAQIPFLAAGQDCQATITNQTSADIKTLAFAGPLVATTDNGRQGYHLVATTPDGKWSVRCFLPNSSQFADVNLQLRYNGSASDPATKDVISNTAYFWGGVGSTQNNQVRYPKNQWAGYNGSTASLVTAVGQTASNFPTWHDPGVYAGGMPEYRLYHWSEADPTYKTFYTMEFMMASTTPSGIANTTNCPSGTCGTTKVFFYLRQITAP